MIAMKKRNPVSPLALAALALSLLARTGVGASEPMLARLSFWVPSERMAEFEVRGVIRIDSPI